MFASYALLGLVFSTVITASDALALPGMLRRFKNTTILVPLVSVVTYRERPQCQIGTRQKARQIRVFVMVATCSLPTTLIIFLLTRTKSGDQIEPKLLLSCFRPAAARETRSCSSY